MAAAECRPAHPVQKVQRRTREADRTEERNRPPASLGNVLQEVGVVALSYCSKHLGLGLLL